MRAVPPLSGRTCVRVLCEQRVAADDLLVPAPRELWRRIVSRCGLSSEQQEPLPRDPTSHLLRSARLRGARRRHGASAAAHSSVHREAAGRMECGPPHGSSRGPQRPLRAARRALHRAHALHAEQVCRPLHVRPRRLSEGAQRLEHSRPEAPSARSVLERVSARSGHAAGGRVPRHIRHSFG